MKLLLIESTPGSATAIEADLVAAGHDVLSCTDDRGGPCKGVQIHRNCPLEAHVDMAILTRRPGAPHTLAEMGSVCARRHWVPLVEVDPTDVADDLPNVAIASALASRRIEAAYATAVRHELGQLQVLVDVRREKDLVHVNVQIPASLASPTRLSAVADRSRHAVRELDPFVRAIDVAVVPYPDPLS
jgi:hypothetical protein